MTSQNKTNNLNYLINPTFNIVNRLFVLSFKNEDKRTSYSGYYIPNVEIKEMIEQQSFSSLKNQKKQLLNFHKNL